MITFKSSQNVFDLNTSLSLHLFAVSNQYSLLELFCCKRNQHLFLFAVKMPSSSTIIILSNILNEVKLVLILDRKLCIIV